MKQWQVTPPRFLVPETLAPGTTVTVGEDAARHMRVRRLGAGSTVVLLDGQGTRATGELRSLAKRNASVEVSSAVTCAQPAPVHLLVPVADRDRMLWLAEKCAELALTSWRPVMWKRSRSVSPRGEGAGFQARVRARMAGALEQSGAAWLPMLFPDASLERAIASLPEAPPGARFVLEPGGTPITRVLRSSVTAPVVVAVGPEGGFETSELDELQRAGFQRVALGPEVLRFETAGVVALAHVRAALAEQESSNE